MPSRVVSGLSRELRAKPITQSLSRLAARSGTVMEMKTTPLSSSVTLYAAEPLTVMPSQ